MPVTRIETWRLSYTFSGRGYATEPCVDKASGEKRVAELEKRVGQNVLWAKVVHEIITTEVETYEIRQKAGN